MINLNASVRTVSSAAFFQKLLILFGAMLSSQVMMVGVFLYLVMVEGQPTSDELMETMMYVVPAVAATALGMSFVLPARMVAAAAAKPTLSGKLQGWQSAFIIRMALLEGPAFLGAIAYFLTGNPYFLLANAVSIVALATAFPAKPKVIDALNLSQEELNIINDPNGIVQRFETTRTTIS